MAYADLLDDESIDSQFLVVMAPRRVVSDWVLSSGTIYYASFEFGQVTKVISDGEELAEAGSTSLSLDEWYFDEVTSRLYIDVGGDPASLQVIATYELYFGTFDAHWHRVPNNTATKVVYYEPLVARSPSIVSSVSDVLFGFLPTFSSEISISNVTNLLQKHLYDSSFNRADVSVWHYLDELTAANVRLVLRGYTSEINSSDDSVSFKIQDATSFFNTQWRNPVGPSFYAPSSFPLLDPNFSGRCVRQVFGVVDGFAPVNVDYDTVATTTNNRDWVCIADETNLGSVSTTVLASPSSTTTRTYLTSISGFRVGDTIWNQTASQYATVTALGVNYVDHTTWTTAASGNTIARSFIGSVTIIKDGVKKDLLFGRDYTEYVDATNKVAGFSLVNNFEAGLSIATFEPTDQIFCRVYGHKNTATLASNPFGSNSTQTGNLTNLKVILWETLKQVLPESALDATTFLGLSVSDEIGLAIPELAVQEFPSIKDLVVEYCSTGLLKIFLDNDLIWTISKLGKFGAVTKGIEDDEILDRSFSYNVSYDDIISRVQVLYANREISQAGGQGEPLVVATESLIAKNLHAVEKQKSFKSLHFLENQAQDLADFLSFVFGDRRAVLTFTTKNRFFDTLLRDVIEVSRDRLIGFDFDQGVLRSRKFAVSETRKSLTEIQITLDDQRGIEESP